MMTRPLFVAAFWSIRPLQAFFLSPCSQQSVSSIRATTRLFASSAAAVNIESSVSRLSTLQTLLSRRGAPGSQGCAAPNDLVPVQSQQDTPELVSSLAGPDDGERANLHPYLFPIAKSASTGNFICAYRNPLIEESDKNHPWPIVETKLNAPGMRLLSLNTEHLMRRIVCECDFEGKDEDLVKLYNEGLGQGLLRDPALDSPYQPGSVGKLGFGVDKFVLLRVGPFPDLYESMALQHSSRGDEQSSLIAAETSNSKMAGFGSTFRFYARLLSSFPSREEESRDAARMCLRLPLPTIGMDFDDFKEVAVLGQMAEESDSLTLAVGKLKGLYMKVKEVEGEEDPNQGKTPEQIAIDEANHLINIAALEGMKWNSIRSELADHFRSVQRDDMARFVDCGE